MSVHEIVLIHTFEWAGGLSLLLQLNVEVRWGSAGCLVALRGEFELSADFHASSYEDLLAAALLTDGASVKADNLAVVVNIFPRTTVEVFQGAFQSHIDVSHRLGQDLIETSKGSAEVRALNLSSLSVNNLAEGVLLQEEFLKDLITVLLIDVSTSAHAIGPKDT